MSAHRSHYRFAPIALCLLLAFAVQQAQAGMFDDEEARRQINDLSIKSNERLDTLSRAQIDLVNQIQSLREENAKLRGQVETLHYELESANKRQQDFYVDLDDRLRKIESASSPGTDILDGGGDPVTGKAADPTIESNEYESALNLLKANKLKEAVDAFGTFAQDHPNGPLTPSAYYWQGSALSSLRNCKKAIEVYRTVADKWPHDPKAPESLLGIALCQQELGDNRGAKASLESIIASYPDSSAASTARQRLKK